MNKYMVVIEYDDFIDVDEKIYNLSCSMGHVEQLVKTLVKIWNSMHNLFIFDKSKTVFLKAVLPILILFHHLNGITKLEYLKPFGVVGIAVVSLFFFISGYGLLASFQKKGVQYLYDFLRKRILPIFCTYIGALALYLLFRAIIYSETIFEYLKVTNFTDWLPYSWFVIELLIMYLLYWGGL